MIALLDAVGVNNNNNNDDHNVRDVKYLRESEEIV